MTETNPPHQCAGPGLPDDARARLRQAFAAQETDIRALLQNFKARLPELTALLERVRSHWHGEDAFYRFYHQSFKVYRLQADTLEIVAALRALRPERHGPEHHSLTPALSHPMGEGTSFLSSPPTSASACLCRRRPRRTTLRRK